MTANPRILLVDDEAAIPSILTPRLDGRAMLRALRDRGNWTPVSPLTRVGDASGRSVASSEGADDHPN